MRLKYCSRTEISERPVMREILLIAAVLSLCWLLPPLARQGRNVASDIFGATNHCVPYLKPHVDQVCAALRLDLGRFELFYRNTRWIWNVGQRAVHAYKFVAPSETPPSDNEERPSPSHPSHAYVLAVSFIRRIVKIARDNPMPASFWRRARSASLHPPRSALWIWSSLAVR